MGAWIEPRTERNVNHYTMVSTQMIALEYMRSNPVRSGVFHKQYASASHIIYQAWDTKTQSCHNRPQKNPAFRKYMLYYMRIKRDLFLLASAWLSLDLASSARFMAYFLVNMLNNMTAPNPEHRISRPAGPTLFQRWPDTEPPLWF